MFPDLYKSPVQSDNQCYFVVSSDLISLKYCLRLLLKVNKIFGLNSVNLIDTSIIILNDSLLNNYVEIL